MAPTLKISVLQNDWGQHAGNLGCDGSSGGPCSHHRLHPGRAARFSRGFTPRLPWQRSHVRRSAEPTGWCHLPLPRTLGDTPASVSLLPETHIPIPKPAADTQGAESARGHGGAATPSPASRRIPRITGYRETWSAVSPAPPDALPRRCGASLPPDRAGGASLISGSRRGSQLSFSGFGIMAATATMATSGSARKRLLKEEDMTKVEFETSEEVDVTPTFDTMGLREDLLRGIYAYGGARASRRGNLADGTDRAGSGRAATSGSPQRSGPAPPGLQSAGLFQWLV